MPAPSPTQKPIGIPNSEIVFQSLDVATARSLIFITSSMSLLSLFESSCNVVVEFDALVNESDDCVSAFPKSSVDCDAPINVVPNALSEVFCFCKSTLTCCKFAPKRFDISTKFIFVVVVKLDGCVVFTLCVLVSSAFTGCEKARKSESINAKANKNFPVLIEPDLRLGFGRGDPSHKNFPHNFFSLRFRYRVKPCANESLKWYLGIGVIIHHDLSRDGFCSYEMR